MAGVLQFPFIKAEISLQFYYAKSSKISGLLWKIFCLIGNHLFSEIKNLSGSLGVDSFIS